MCRASTGSRSSLRAESAGVPSPNCAARCSRSPPATISWSLGASDNHGWASDVRLECLAARGAGFHTNRVFARRSRSVQATGGPGPRRSPQPWFLLRSLSWSERASWLTWVVIILLYRAMPRREGQPAGLGILARSLGPPVTQTRFLTRPDMTARNKRRSFPSFFLGDRPMQAAGRGSSFSVPFWRSRHRPARRARCR